MLINKNYILIIISNIMEGRNDVFPASLIFDRLFEFLWMKPDSMED